MLRPCSPPLFLINPGLSIDTKAFMVMPPGDKSLNYLYLSHVSHHKLFGSITAVSVNEKTRIAWHLCFMKKALFDAMDMEFCANVFNLLKVMHNLHHRLRSLFGVRLIFSHFCTYCRTGKVRECDYFANTRTTIALAILSHAIYWVLSYAIHHWRWWRVGRWISPHRRSWLKRRKIRAITSQNHYDMIHC